MPENAETWFRAHVEASARAHSYLADDCAKDVLRAAALIGVAFAAGHKLLLCGNGGSAADCQHVAAEFVSRFDPRIERPGLPAIALTTDTSFLTAYANDFDYRGVFARQVQALGSPGDVMLCISTSGGSANVGAAIQAARAGGLACIGLFGAEAPLAAHVDVAILIPGDNTQVIQECMLTVEHAICELVERELYPQTAS